MLIAPFSRKIVSIGEMYSKLVGVTIILFSIQRSDRNYELLGPCPSQQNLATEKVNSRTHIDNEGKANQLHYFYKNRNTDIKCTLLTDQGTIYSSRIETNLSFRERLIKQDVGHWCQDSVHMISKEHICYYIYELYHV